MDLRDAYAFCRKKAFGHYENFPVASLLLPQPQRNAIAALYAFARLADDFADEPQYGPQKNRLSLLRSWSASLGKAPQGHVFLALADARRRFQIGAQPFKDLVSAFSQDCLKPRYGTFSEVWSYCRRSANPVGRVVLRVFGMDSPAAVEESDCLCTGLQLANFWQDLASDCQARSRFYIPQDEMKRFRVAEGELKAGQFSDRLRELMRFQVNRTEAFFAQGEGLIGRLQGRLKAEIRLTLLGGRRILEKIRAQGYDTLSRRPALGIADLPALAWRFVTGAAQ